MSSSPEFDPVRLLQELAAAKVDFVLIGGLAVIAHGYPRVTKDVDVVYDTARDNLERLGRVMVKLGAELRDEQQGLPFVADGLTLRRTTRLMLRTTAGAIDLLVDPDGAPRYRELRAHAEVIDLFGQPIRVASVPHLIAMKRAAGRPVDETDLKALEVIRRAKAREEGR